MEPQTALELKHLYLKTKDGKAAGWGETWAYSLIFFSTTGTRGSMGNAYRAPWHSALYSLPFTQNVSPVSWVFVS